MSSDKYAVPDEYEDYQREILRLIDEVEEEYGSLSDYIGILSGHLRERHERYEESRKQYGFGIGEIGSQGLHRYFPNTLNYSFVIFAFLTLENHLRILTNIIFDRQGIQGAFHDYLRRSYRGGNFDKYLSFYSDQVRRPHTRLQYWPQIDGLTKLRDCLVHVSGFLADSRDKNELERMIKTRDYFSERDKKKPRVTYPSENYFSMGEIEIDAFDERLVVGGEYCKQVCWYLERFVMELLENSDMAIYAEPD